MKDETHLRARVRDAIVARAPERMITGGRAALSASIDEILDAWIQTAADQTSGGSAFGYADRKTPQRLMHQPLESVLPNLSPAHRKFVAGRSMRDVEISIALRVTDPRGNPIANADDLA